MLIYVINRLLQLIPIVFILTIVVFCFVQALPGDIIDTLAGQEGTQDPEVRAALDEQKIDSVIKEGLHEFADWIQHQATDITGDIQREFFV